MKHEKFPEHQKFACLGRHHQREQQAEEEINGSRLMAEHTCEVDLWFAVRGAAASQQPHFQSFFGELIIPELFSSSLESSPNLPSFFHWCTLSGERAFWAASKCPLGSQNSDEPGCVGWLMYAISFETKTEGWNVLNWILGNRTESHRYLVELKWILPWLR